MGKGAGGRQLQPGPNHLPHILWKVAEKHCKLGVCVGAGDGAGGGGGCFKS